ncbi:MAG: hypothetical protein LKG27_04070 [Clostridiaceae bacterium]|jgi:hypothetical protein|nr:hypothetical protein [Clostridiaceae bacterium]
MGCLKNTVRAVIITLAVVGFVSIGGKEWLMPHINNIFHPSPNTILEKAKKVGDFSKESDEFELEKATGVMGYNAVVAQHKASGQKMFVVESGKKEIITQEDLKSPNIQSKLRRTAKRVKYQSISAQDIVVTKQGMIDAYGQKVPYVKFNAKVSKLPIGEVSGIVAVVKDKDGKPRTLLSVNEKRKYSQLVAEDFFKNIR